MITLRKYKLIVNVLAHNTFTSMHANAQIEDRFETLAENITPDGKYCDLKCSKLIDKQPKHSFQFHYFISCC